MTTDARHYDAILAPVITEKATMLTENNQVVFQVPLTATKPQIKEAVEALFKVKVKAVNTVRVEGKIKRFRGQIGKRSDFKKAIVTLNEGDTIDISTGL
ncbi:50S ribosomal protein L23 [Pseudaquidulcibacter saccharophilus]|uniref:50S ribosomal protein L23 n=1 Tax=Pseudaquidulcibacter saccharophilus TaxID=2831900 RepID=UPI001EFF561F|nr:50S ribosomal protein L23 [Pseudaquidulcibacter saccharophilus]